MARSEQEERFAAFYHAHFPLIRATCFRRLGDRQAAEDAAIETFRVAWQHQLAGEELTLRWLYGVARNLVGNEYRRVRRVRALHEKLTVNADGASPNDDDDEAVREVLTQLPEAHREVLFMTYWEDLSAGEVAEILGVSTAAVWTRLKRARRAFEKQWTQLNNDNRSEVTSWTK